LSGIEHWLLPISFVACVDLPFSSEWVIEDAGQKLRNELFGFSRETEQAVALVETRRSRSIDPIILSTSALSGC
jgi:hypothetical protein